jgi:hypothetical protein
VDFVDPVHPLDFNPVTANTTQGLINLNGNLTYQPFSWITAYFTYDYSTSTTDGQGGGYSIGSDNKFDNPNFRNASDLYEGGFKFNLLDGKLFLAMAGFRQTRSIPQENAPTLPEIVWGGEAELNYQPNRNFYVTLSFMMKRTAFASRSNRVAQAWPNRATGATLPNGSSRRKSEGQISIPLHLHRSLQAPRSYKAIPRAYFRLQGPLARKPANNQYP